MENNNNSEQKELIADVINVVINRLDVEFEKEIKEGHYSEAEELLTKAWVKVYCTSNFNPSFIAKFFCIFTVP